MAESTILRDLFGNPAACSSTRAERHDDDGVDHAQSCGSLARLDSAPRGSPKNAQTLPNDGDVTRKPSRRFRLGRHR